MKIRLMMLSACLMIATEAHGKPTVNAHQTPGPTGGAIQTTPYEPTVLVNRNDALYCLNPYMMEEARRLVRTLMPHLLKEVGCGVVPAQTKVRWIGEIGTELFQVVGEKETDDDAPVWVRADDFRNALEWAQYDVCSPVDVSCLTDVAARFAAR